MEASEKTVMFQSSSQPFQCRRWEGALRDDTETAARETGENGFVRTDCAHAQGNGRTAETAELPRAFASSACIAHNILAPRQIIQWDCQHNFFKNL